MIYSTDLNSMASMIATILIADHCDFEHYYVAGRHELHLDEDDISKESAVVLRLLVEMKNNRIKVIR